MKVHTDPTDTKKWYFHQLERDVHERRGRRGIEVHQSKKDASYPVFLQPFDHFPPLARVGEASYPSRGGRCVFFTT